MNILHTMLRVGNLDRSIAFYTDILGMRLLRRQNYPDGRFTLAFVGYCEEESGAVLELTHNWDTSTYEIGNGFGHIALGVDDAYATCDLIKAKGGKAVRKECGAARLVRAIEILRKLKGLESLIDVSVVSAIAASP